MHLKNFSLITKDHKTTLSPAYDLINSTIVLEKSREEIALPINGKKNNLTRRDFINYFAMEKLGLNQNIINEIMQEIQQAIPAWKELVNDSFLSAAMKKKYLNLLDDRLQRMQLC
jgi:serine/threonine-protein kinase HipA